MWSLEVCQFCESSAATESLCGECFCCDSCCCGTHCEECGQPSKVCEATLCAGHTAADNRTAASAPRLGQAVVVRQPLEDL